MLGSTQLPGSREQPGPRKEKKCVGNIWKYKTCKNYVQPKLTPVATISATPSPPTVAGRGGLNTEIIGTSDFRQSFSFAVL